LMGLDSRARHAYGEHTNHTPPIKSGKCHIGGKGRGADGGPRAGGHKKKGGGVPPRHTNKRQDAGPKDKRTMQPGCVDKRAAPPGMGKLGRVSWRRVCKGRNGGKKKGATGHPRV